MPGQTEIQQAKHISDALAQLGVPLKMEYEARKLAGGKFVFHEPDSKVDLKPAEISQRMSEVRAGLVGDSKEVKRIWLKNLEDFIDPKTGAIGGSKATDPDFVKLADMAESLDRLQKVVWDLKGQDVGKSTKTGHANSVNIARALTNIAEQSGNRMHFEADAQGKIHYSSEKMLGSSVDTAARGIIETALAKDGSLTAGSNLNDKGQKLADAILATPGQIALDKAGASTETVVNLIENLNILATVDRDVPVRFEKGGDVYGNTASADKPKTGQILGNTPVKVQGSLGGINLGGLKNTVNQVKNMAKGSGTNDAFGAIDHGGMAEADVIAKLPVTLVEDHSAEFVPPATPTNTGKTGGKAGGKSGGKGKH